MGERMTWLSQRNYKAAALALAGGLSLVGCTAGDADGNQANNTADRMECTADPAGEWKPAEDNFKNEVVAVPLGVDADEVSKSGTFGPVSCPEQIELVDIIEEGDGLIISVKDQGPNCFVYNRLEDEKKGYALCVDTE